MAEFDLTKQRIYPGWQMRRWVKHPITLGASSLLLVGAIGFCDFLAGHEVSLSLFFLIPVSIAVIGVSLSFGLFISACCGIIWYLNDVASPMPHSHWLIPVWNSFMRLGYFCLHSIFLSRYVAESRLNKQLAETDALTGAYNLRYFKKALEGNIHRPSWTLAYADLDHFKQINDRHGHAAGNIVLINFCDLIRSKLRADDVLARIGGDEFAFILYGQSADDARRILDNIIKGAQELFETENSPVTVSIGAVTGHLATGPFMNHLSRADALMYEAKQNGRNTLKHELDSRS